MIRINFFKNFNLGSIKSLRGGAEASGESQAKPIPAQPTVAAKGMPASLDPVAMDGKGGDTMAGKVEHQPFAKDTLVDYQQESQSEWKLEPRAGKIIGPETAAVGYKEMGPESMAPRNLRGEAQADEAEFKKFKSMPEIGFKEMGPGKMAPHNLRGGAQVDELEVKYYKNMPESGIKEMGPESMTPRNLRGGARADEPEFKNFKNTQTTQTSAADDELQSPKDSGWIKE